MTALALYLIGVILAGVFGLAVVPPPDPGDVFPVPRIVPIVLLMLCWPLVVLLYAGYLIARLVRS